MGKPIEEKEPSLTSTGIAQGLLAARSCAPFWRLFCPALNADVVVRLCVLPYLLRAWFSYP